MRKRAIPAALGLVSVGVVLGATVFRQDLAEASALAQGVLVTNTPSQAVPVREQNVDGTNIRVHEQGTANVKTASVSKHDRVIVLGDNVPRAIGPLAASLVIVSMRSDAHVSSIRFFNGTEAVFDLSGPIGGGPAYSVLPLTQPVPVSSVEILCTDNVNCVADVQAIGS